MDRRDQGRSLLARWEASKPANFYDDDAYLRLALRRHMGRERLARVASALRQAGADSAGPVNEDCAELDRPEHLPRLESWSAIGERRADIVFHPTHHAIGRLVWRSGILSLLGEPGNVTAHAALAYLFGMNGEVPHLCSVACTAGLIKVIQRSAPPWMRERWLPRLLDPDYDRRWHGAQFLTEVQGGSDIGANTCVAARVPDEPGQWRLSGEKWFCSNVSADLYAVTARPEGGSAGTRGIALFLVPRCLEDGRPNGVSIRRLKNKLGTRTLPTAEVDFQGALAYQLGALDDGFKLMMGVVINTSRLAVAVGACGMMRRAWVEAWSYARVREAFGQRLVDFPAVRHLLAEMRVLGTAGLAFTMFVAGREDHLALTGGRPEEDPIFRMAVTVDKCVCSIDAGRVVHHAIEILGGNGTIEDFGPLPRLYREAPVQESWEGPHNTLMAQVLRDAGRSKMHEALLGHARDALLAIGEPDLVAIRDGALTALEEVAEGFRALLGGEPRYAALHARAVIGRMARILQVALLLQDAEESAGERLGWLPAAAQLLLDREVRLGFDPLKDPSYLALVDRVLAS